MAKLEPGETFEIEYAGGKTTKVLALSLRQKRTVTTMLSQVQSLSGDERNKVYDLIAEMLELCVPGDAEELMDKIDEADAMEIVGLTLGGSAMQEADKKK